MNYKEPTEREITQAHDRCYEDGFDCADCPFNTTWEEPSEFWGQSVSETLRECTAIAEDCPSLDKYLYVGE